MSRKQANPESNDFFTLIPRRSRWVFFLAVFFTFAPVSPLLGSRLVGDPPLAALLIYAGVSGLLAVSWAATFTVSRVYIVGIVVFTAMIVAVSGPLRNSWIGLGQSGPSLAGLLFVFAIVVGYVLFIVFISGQGRTTLRLMTEMNLARSIHATLVPPIEFAGGGLQVLGSSTPSTEMGGDLIDLVRHEDATDVFVADVSGHGVRAGVVMGMVKAAIRTKTLRREDFSAMLGDLNDVLEDTTSPELFATFAGLRIDHRNRRAEYAVAGHHPILHYRAGTGDLARLGDRSLPLGMMSGSRYSTTSVDLSPGDLLAVYTDGLNESMNEADEELGHDAIEHAILRCADRPLSEIRSALLDLARAHGRQDDDRSLLLVRIAP